MGNSFCKCVQPEPTLPRGRRRWMFWKKNRVAPTSADIERTSDIEVIAMAKPVEEQHALDCIKVIPFHGTFNIPSHIKSRGGNYGYGIELRPMTSAGEKKRQQLQEKIDLARMNGTLHVIEEQKVRELRDKLDGRHSKARVARRIKETEDYQKRNEQRAHWENIIQKSNEAALEKKRKELNEKQRKAHTNRLIIQNNRLTKLEQQEDHRELVTHRNHLISTGNTDTASASRSKHLAAEARYKATIENKRQKARAQNSTALVKMEQAVRKDAAYLEYLKERCVDKKVKAARFLIRKEKLIEAERKLKEQHRDEVRRRAAATPVHLRQPTPTPENTTSPLSDSSDEYDETTYEVGYNDDVDEYDFTYAPERTQSPIVRRKRVKMPTQAELDADIESDFEDEESRSFWN